MGLQSFSKERLLTGLLKVVLDTGHWRDIIDPLCTLASLKSCVFSSIAEGEDHKRGFRFNGIAFRTDTSNADDAPGKIADSVTAEVIVSVAQPNGAGPATTTHVQSISRALQHVKEALVVRDKGWHDKHDLWYKYDDVDSDEESGDEDGDEDEADSDASDDSEDE